MPAIKCPKCGGLTDSNEPYCLRCGARLGKVYHIERLLNYLFGDLDTGRVFVFFIILIYSLHILFSILDASKATEWKLENLPFFKPHILSLLCLGIQDNERILENGEVWRLVTSLFVHLDILHLLFNGLAAWYILPMVEEEYGKAKTIILFFLTGLAGSLASLYFDINGGGASGALFGLIGAMFVFGFKRGGVYGNEIKKKMLFWAIYAFGFGFLVNANQVAHGAGFISGIALAPVISWNKKRFARTKNTLAAICILIIIASWILSFAHYRENMVYFLTRYRF